MLFVGYQRPCWRCACGNITPYHALLSKHDRLLRLEKTYRELTIGLNDEQIRLLDRFSPEFQERQLLPPFSQALVEQNAGL